MSDIAVFEVSEEPYIPVDYMDINGNWHTFQTLADTGNQKTIIDTSTAKALGWDMEGDTFAYVQGVFGNPEQVPVNHDVVLRIGDTEPIVTNIRVADIGMNLLGFDVMNQFFTVTFDGDLMIFEQKAFCSACVPEEAFQDPYEEYYENDDLGRDW